MLLLPWIKTVSKNSFSFAKKFSIPLLILCGFLFWWFPTSGVYPLPDYLSKILILLGKAILYGGFFSVFIKCFQLLGIFRNEIEKVFFEHDFFNTYNMEKIQSLWHLASDALYKGHFPQIKGLNQIVIDKYFLANRDYYFSHYNRKFTVNWLNGKKNKDLMVEVTDELKITVLQAANRSSIEYIYSFTAAKGTPGRETNQEVISLKIDGKEYKDKHKRDKDYEVQHPDKIKYAYIVPLNGKESYSVTRVNKIIFSLHEDPLWIYSITRFSEEIDICVACIPDDLIIDFENLERASAFEDTSFQMPHKTRCRDLSKSFKGLIFPGSGFILNYRLDLVDIK